MTISKSEGNKELQNNRLFVSYNGFFPNEKDILNAQRLFFFPLPPNLILCLFFFFVLSIVLEGMTHDISSIPRKCIFILQPYFNVSSWHSVCSFLQCVKCAIQLSHVHDSTKMPSAAQPKPVGSIFGVRQQQASEHCKLSASERAIICFLLNKETIGRLQICILESLKESLVENL